MSHFVIRCRVCDGVLQQCRCPALDKQIQYSSRPCENCLDKAASEELVKASDNEREK